MTDIKLNLDFSEYCFLSMALRSAIYDEENFFKVLRPEVDQKLIYYSSKKLENYKELLKKIDRAYKESL